MASSAVRSVGGHGRFRGWAQFSASAWRRSRTATFRSSPSARRRYWPTHIAALALDAHHRRRDSAVHRSFPAATSSTPQRPVVAPLAWQGIRNLLLIERGRRVCICFRFYRGSYSDRRCSELGCALGPQKFRRLVACNATALRGAPSLDDIFLFRDVRGGHAPTVPHNFSAPSPFLRCWLSRRGLGQLGRKPHRRRNLPSRLECKDGAGLGKLLFSDCIEEVPSETPRPPFAPR